ncbi:MAG TPA: RNB domain-containing ribonuclease, partial [Candidatus Thermoplasmatota archaeon]|nr:RNB domain-containing ribonuclease [Candidatus Thermoplasmatota archaeon]
MKPGDLVEFKDGLFGIAAPLNFGIYLSRERQGRNYFAILYTVKGRKEVKTDHIKGVRLSAPFSGDLTDEDLKSRLETLLGEASTQVKQQAAAPGEINDRDVWRKVNMLGEALTPEEMAASFYETKAPSKSQVESIRQALLSCQRPGIGYFERAPDRVERWRPLPSLSYRDVKRDIEGYNGLRKKLILIEEVPPEDEWTPPKTVYHGVPLPEAGLTEEDQARLHTIKRAMEDFVLHDRWTGNVGLGGTGVHTIDGFRFLDYLKWLAYDWTGTTRISVSSAFVEFLMRTDLLTPGDALLLVARRKVLGHPDFEWDTPADVLRAADRIPEEVVPEAKVGRVDLTHLRTWTIDPADAKDHDDAISFRENPDGTTTLWVHIADVSHYVEKETTLDHDARKRATSVYLPTGVLPMLPPKLSDGLCSLNEGVDRLALTAILTYNSAGSLVKEEFVEAVIRVTGNVSYEEVLAQIQAGDPRNEFVRLEAFARKLDEKRRGLVLETGERRVRIREGQVVHQIKQGNAATKMIEVFMVAANEAVARKLTAESVPLLYRCHPLPDRSSVERFNGQMLTMQLPIEIMLPPPEDVELQDTGAPGAPKEEGGGSMLDALKQ